MFGQSSQTTGIFGTSTTSAPAASTTPGAFGHQRNTTSLFAPPTGTTSTTTAPFSFNAAAPTSSAPSTTTPSLFGGSTTNQGTSFTFGNTTTQQQQQQQPPSLFGSTATTNKPTQAFSFGNTTTTQTQQKPLFGSTTTTTTTQPSLFGSTTGVAVGSSTQQPSLFGASQQQQGSSLFGTSQQQQQQGSTLLSLQAAFPDTNVPYFTIRPDGINRTVFPSNFFVDEGSSSSEKKSDNNKTTPNAFIYKGKEITISLFNSDHQQNENSNSRRSLSSSTATSSRPFGDKRKVLPGFLTGTSAQSTENAITGQKRFLNSNDMNTRRVLSKSTSSPASSSGIFGGQPDDSYVGFGKRKPTDIDIDQPPVSSLWDVGVNPKPAIMSANLNDMKKNITMTSGFNEQGIKTGTSTSVSIFGYPSSLTSQVLEYFIKCGDVVNKTLSDGNWMTIQYATEEGAKKALENNGRILQGNYMVGVTPLISATTTTITGNNNTVRSAPPSSSHPPTVILAQPAQGVFKPHDKPATSGLFGFFTKSTSTSALSSSTSSSTTPSFSTAQSSLSSSTPSSEFTNERGQQVTKIVDDSYASWIRNHLRF